MYCFVLAHCNMMTRNIHMQSVLKYTLYATHPSVTLCESDYAEILLAVSYSRFSKYIVLLQLK